MTILVVISAVALAGLGLWIVGRRSHHVEEPTSANNWQNEEYAEFEKGGKLKSESVSPLDDGRSSF